MSTAIQSASATSASQADIPATVEELRVCSDCCEVRLLTDFRRRFRGREDRMYQCRQCHASAEFQRRKHHREIRTGQRMKAIATAARNPKAMKRLLMLIDTGVIASGGFENLLRDWYATIQKSIDRGAVSAPRLLGFYESMFAIASWHRNQKSSDSQSHSENLAE